MLSKYKFFQQNKFRSWGTKKNNFKHRYTYLQHPLGGYTFCFLFSKTQCHLPFTRKNKKNHPWSNKINATTLNTKKLDHIASRKDKTDIIVVIITIASPPPTTAFNKPHTKVETIVKNKTKTSNYIKGWLSNAINFYLQ